MPPVFEISADQLATLYASLRCDGCGETLTPDPTQTWVKSGCGYFCPACIAAGTHLTHPSCRR